ncbi:hypothetical protein ABE437_00380 [Isoptericola cucumis]|uniref:hypothetical protein n=1 Tax=Isoptericola cucumis TaxID=1776856 RepID=UPI003208FE81
MITTPPSSRAMPRWWHDDAGRSWLDELPARVAERCAAWGLDLDAGPGTGPTRWRSRSGVTAAAWRCA